MPSIKALLPAALLALCGCQSPVDVTLEFHKALSQRDGEKALGLLSAGSRSELEKRAKEAEQRSGGAVSGDAAQMIVQGDTSIYPSPGPTGAAAASAKLVSQDEKLARVEVTIGQTREEVTLVRETGGWKIELPLARRPAGQ